MTEDTIEIEIEHELEDRYSRLRLVGWDPSILKSARLLVAGAGALGNEVVKGLALLGVGTILVVDFDHIEVTNFSRCVFFRPGDEGQPKAAIVAQRAKELNPAVDISWLHGDLRWQIGAGIFRRVDLVLGCLDNRVARLMLNRYCWLTGRPWIDGGLAGLDGRVRLFGPSTPPCYECTLGERDYQLLYRRDSCLGGLDDAATGIVPTTPTSAAIIAAIQVQEAIRWLHGLPVQFGGEVVYTATPPSIFRSTMHEKAECMSHETAEPLIELGWASAAQTTVGEILAAAQKELGENTTLILDYEVVTQLFCQVCMAIEPWLGSLYAVEATCPRCGNERLPLSFHRINQETPCLDRRLSEIGIPPGHILCARHQGCYCYFELSGDFPAALTPPVVERKE